MTAYNPYRYERLHRSTNPRINKRKVKAFLRALIWALAVFIKEVAS